MHQSFRATLLKEICTFFLSDAGIFYLQLTSKLNRVLLSFFPFSISDYTSIITE